MDWEILILDLIGRPNRGSRRTGTVEDSFQEGYGTLCGSGGNAFKVVSAGELYRWDSMP